MPPRPLRLRELAERLGGRRVEGDAEASVSAVASLEDAGPTDLGFLRSAAFAKRLAGSRVGALVAPEGVDVGGRPVIRSPRPNLDFARAAGILHPVRRPEPGVHPSAFVAPDAHVDASASVGPLAVVEAGARIGARTVVGARVVVGEAAEVGEDGWLHPGAVVAQGTRLGDRVVLQPGAVIGGDGFGYAFDEAGALEKVPQVGTVVVGDDVEIGANATVDRARLGATRIGNGVKIDNLVQIGHNCVVGDHCVVVAQSGLAGSTTLGARVVVLAQAGCANHVTVGEGSILGVRAGVVRDLPPRSHALGFPSIPGRAWHRSMAWFARLPELARRLRRLERRLGLDDGGSAGADVPPP